MTLRIVPTRLGWCRVDADGSPAAVRFDGVERLVVAEQSITGPGSLPTRQLVAWVNGPEGEPVRLGVKDRGLLAAERLAAADDRERGEPTRRAAWGTSDEAVAGMERMVDLSLVPTDLSLVGASHRRKPEGFYERFATLYRRVGLATGRQAKAIAAANGVKASAVQGWVKVCRARGLL